jgi:hypothetical protein
MIVFNKKLVTEHNQIKKAWNQLLMQRESFNVNQNTFPLSTAARWKLTRLR